MEPTPSVPCLLCFRRDCLDPQLHEGMIRARLAFNEAFGDALTRAVLDATRH